MMKMSALLWKMTARSPSGSSFASAKTKRKAEVVPAAQRFRVRE